MAGDALHRRITADIIRRIEAGEWRHGGQVPSRAEFAAEYEVHEQTVRLAMVLLRKDGYVEGGKGKRLTVVYRPAVRSLTDPDAPWPHSTETTDTEPCRASAELAERLGVHVGTTLHHETVECMDPGGRSAMLVVSWWRDRRRGHVRAVVEVGAVRLGEVQAHSLGLSVDTVAFRLVRTRLGAGGVPVETADLILPMDRWELRFTLERP